MGSSAYHPTHGRAIPTYGPRYTSLRQRRRLSSCRHSTPWSPRRRQLGVSWSVRCASRPNSIWASGTAAGAVATLPPLTHSVDQRVRHGYRWAISCTGCGPFRVSAVPLEKARSVHGAVDVLYDSLGNTEP